MAVEIRCRYTTGTYVATVKGHRQTASNTASALQAAEAMARKLGLDPALLVERSRDLLGPQGPVIFTHPGGQQVATDGRQGNRPIGRPGRV